MDAFDIARLVYLNGGQLVGKTRLQKSAYFLETKGAGFGFDFGYHHFGPYSEELTDATDDAQALRLLSVDWKASQGGTHYAIFHSISSDLKEDEKDAIRRKVLNVLKEFTAVEVELAATAHFLKCNGYASEPWTETRRRKSSKVDERRLIRAKKLLEEIESI